MREIGKSKGAGVARVALAYVLAKPFVSGTGFFITGDGHLVTSHHLSWGAASIVGQSVAVPLCIDELDGIAGLDMVINYDRSDLTFVSVDKGAALADYLSWETNAEFEQNDQSGQIRLTTARSTRRG